MTEHDLARTRERVVEDVFAELRRAETTHPSWPTDPFVGVAAGRACLRVADLIRLAEMIERLREEAGR